MALTVGDRVMISGKGSGAVVRVDGRKVLVKLDNLNFPISVDVDQVQVKGAETASQSTIPDSFSANLSPTASKSVSQSAESVPVQVPSKEYITRHDNSTEPARLRSPSSRSPEQISLLRDIESLRYGVVPYGSIEHLTVGFAEIEKWVKSRMPERLGHRSVSEVIGAFGTGKSHSMSLIRHIARKGNYLTARVEIDGGEITLANPEGLLRALWPTLQGQDFAVSAPILELCIRAIDRNESVPRIKAKIERAYENFKSVEKLHRAKRLDEITEELDGVMSCSGEYGFRDVQNRINRELLRSNDCTLRPPIASTPVKEKPAQFLECLISYALLAERAGYTGLVITIDEFEIEEKNTLANRKRIVELVIMLIEYFQELKGYVPSPLAVFFASVEEEDTIGNRLIAEIAGEDEKVRYKLKELSKEDILALSKLIFESYKQAYSLAAHFDKNLASNILQHVETRNIEGLSVVRQFIKTWLYTLDATYGPGPRKDGR